MKYLKTLEEMNLKEKTAITLGKFNALHKGHQKLINRILELQKEGYFAAVLSFSKPPSSVILGKSPIVLITNEERHSILENQGIDCLIEFPFSNEIAKMEPEDFIKKILVDKLNVKYIIVGRDFHFGHNRSGDIHTLEDLADTYGFKVEALVKEKSGSRDISATWVKEEVKEGNIELANQLLGYPFSIPGVVVKGNQYGRKLGMPTANLVPDSLKLLPPNGVYFSKTNIDGTLYKGITNIGRKPTIGDGLDVSVETHLFHCNKDLYGKKISVSLLVFRRPEMKFLDMEQLKSSMEKDMQAAKEYWDISE